MGDTTKETGAPWALQGRETAGGLQSVFMVVAGGPRVGDLLARGWTKILNEAWVLCSAGFCIAVACMAAQLQAGFRMYDAP